MRERIGVYICHCGGNIAEYVDVSKVREIIEKEPGVALAKDTMFACADSSQKEAVEDIKNNKLDAMVVASCSPKLHLYTFRNVAERAGLNPYNYVQCNIREQCSWAHTDKPRDATNKAIRLIRAAVGRVRHSEALSQIEVPALNAILIIGAGISGLRAAIALADMGTYVYLIEKSHFIGGRTAQMGELFTSEDKGEKIIGELHDEVSKRTNINLFTGARLESISGCVGDFKSKVIITPRYIKSGCSRERLEQALQACPDSDSGDDFNFGLTKRKAVYQYYKQARPNLPAVDKDILESGDSFFEEYKACIDLNQKDEVLTLNIGAVIVSTGFDPYEPDQGEYGYKKIESVITLPQLLRLIELNRDDLIFHEKRIKSIVFIYCVGSRQDEGENKYCSRYCCTSTIHTSLLLSRKYPDIKSYHLYRDIRTYGKQEMLYDEASRNGDIFCKFDPESPPEVINEHGRFSVKFNDLLFDNETLEIEPDLVVLVTGMVPRKDSHEIGDIVKIPIGNDKFFNEVHPKLRPVETVIDGIYICGTCQGPKNIAESINSSLSAAVKANALVGSGKIELEPTIIRINTGTCTWCGKCADVCDYNCISKATIGSGKEIAVVNKATCKGCGMCAPVCPEDAIEIVGYMDKQMEAMIDGLIKK